jgi:hypothetical protein
VLFSKALIGCHRARNPVGLLRDVHLSKAAGRRDIHSLYNALNVGAQLRPLLLTKDHYRDFTTGKILLIAHILVGRQS